MRVIQVVDENRKSFNLAPTDSLTLESWETYGDEHITVIAGEKRWQYKPEYISYRFGELKYFSYWLFKVQIEEDGKVFVLKPGKEFPQANHITQPEGYPLTPLDENV